MVIKSTKTYTGSWFISLEACNIPSMSSFCDVELLTLDSEKIQKLELEVGLFLSNLVIFQVGLPFVMLNSLPSIFERFSITYSTR